MEKEPNSDVHIRPLASFVCEIQILPWSVLNKTLECSWCYESEELLILGYKRLIQDPEDPGKLLWWNFFWENSSWLYLVRQLPVKVFEEKNTEERDHSICTHAKFSENLKTPIS